MEHQEQKRVKGPNEKFCSDCGEAINISADSCPECGVQFKGNLNKTALLLITFFLGGIGAHKFYTAKYVQGALYLIFSLTGIPGLISFIEFIIYAFTSTEDLQEKYPDCGGGGTAVVVIIGFIGAIMIPGIIAAIAIPQFAKYKNRGLEIAIESELQSLLSAEQEHYDEYNTYTTNLDALNYYPESESVTIEILYADSICFEAAGEHDEIDYAITINCNGIIE